MDFTFYFLFFILGLITGSFLNVCIFRVPAGESIVNPPSHCPQCNKRLRFYDLVPVISYVILGGRCRFCRSAISPQYPLVEILTGILFVMSLWKYGLTVETGAAVFLAAFFICLSFIDLHHHIIPDRIIITGLVAGVALKFHSLPGIIDSLAGMALGGGILLLVGVISRGGMGGGDIKMSAVAGIFLGWKNILLMLFTGFLSGAAVSILLLAAGKKGMKDTVPFGPFLALGGITALLAGDFIKDFYINLF